MKEKEPQSPAEPIPIEKARRSRQSRRGRVRWNIDAVAEHLHVEPLAVVDEALGEGRRFILGLADPVTALELYPATSAARIRCQGLLLELTGIAPPLVTEEDLSPDEESVVLANPPSGNDLRVGVNAQGDVSLFIAAHQALKKPEIPAAAPEVEATSQSAEAPAESPAEKLNEERLTIFGRVGAAPVLRTTPKGVLIARFPLAQRQEENTIWHQVLAFGDRAERVREIKKGQQVEVVGYLHEREAKGRDGQQRVVKEIYAAVIKEPKG